MARELIAKWEVVSKLITLQNNYNFFKNEWDAERLYREIAKLEIEIGKTPAIAIDNNVGHKWIPVTERLPDKYQLVLAVCKIGKIFVGEYVDLGWRTLWRIRTARDSTKEITWIVTHWMPLPEPPKGE
jgi:hypothetical protein